MYKYQKELHKIIVLYRRYTVNSRPTPTAYCRSLPPTVTMHTRWHCLADYPCISYSFKRFYTL